MLNLTQDQTAELDFLLIRLQGDGKISDEQRREIMRAVLGLPAWTDQDERIEQAWTDRVAPAPGEDQNFRQPGVTLPGS